MSLKCFDYECKSHGTFEKFWDTDEADFSKQAPCNVCGNASPRVFVEFPQADILAFGAWNQSYDPQTGQFHDKKKYRQAIADQGRMIAEPGLDRDAKENDRHYIEKIDNQFKGEFRKWIADHTIDELRAKVKVDAKIHEATMKGDANAIRAMGGQTSIDDVASSIADDKFTVRNKNV